MSILAYPKSKEMGSLLDCGPIFHAHNLEGIGGFGVRDPYLGSKLLIFVFCK